jgi:hypothetical protein
MNSILDVITQDIHQYINDDISDLEFNKRLLEVYSVLDHIKESKDDKILDINPSCFPVKTEVFKHTKQKA